MKKNNEYQTTAGSPFAPFRIPVGTFIAMTLFSLIALKYSLLIFWIMIGAGILGAVLQYFQMRNTFSHWQVVFKEKTLYLTCLLRKKTWVIEDLTYSDFFLEDNRMAKRKRISVPFCCVANRPFPWIISTTSHCLNSTSKIISEKPNAALHFFAKGGSFC